jgi:hypothetical protein
MFVRCKNITEKISQRHCKLTVNVHPSYLEQSSMHGGSNILIEATSSIISASLLITVHIDT